MGPVLFDLREHLLMDPKLEAMERDVVFMGLTAPRIDLNHVNAMMERVSFVTEQPKDTTLTLTHAFLDGKFFLGTGQTSCVDPRNFNAEFGERYSLENAKTVARSKLFELEGYLLYLHVAGNAPGQVPSHETD